jgi:hypothetical protein
MPFCHGDPGEIGRSRMPIALILAVKTCLSLSQIKSARIQSPKHGSTFDTSDALNDLSNRRILP